MNSVLQLHPSSVVEFGPFRLHSSARRLEKDGDPVKIGSRALDILICLAEQPGQPISKPALIKRVWRDLVVEDGSLRVNIAALRKTLDDGGIDSQYIANIPGQGYCLVAPVSDARADSATAHNPCPPMRFAYPVPNPLHHVVGRAHLVPMLASQLRSHRFVTIIGPGGIGKTTVAIAIAHALRSQFNDVVCFIDLGSLTSPDQLANTILATLGLPVAGSAQNTLVAWLHDKKCLLILDNCEHLIDTVASLAEQLYQAAPQLCILATSREALRVDGEYVHRLPPLEVPPEGAHLSAAQALTFPAVQLFVERARSGGSFDLSDAEAPLVAQICRQLDGIALAIELYAGRVATFGVKGTVDLLSKGLVLSCPGRRTASPRHQTLTAMLDWSYSLLPECERQILRRLSVFVGLFTLEAALDVAIESPKNRARLIAALDSLVSKSLVSVELSPFGIRYCLLESTRTYCREKLVESEEAQLIFRRNAEHMTSVLQKNADEACLFQSLELQKEQLEYLGNLRSCLEWCFADNGDLLLGARLCAAGMPTLLRCSLLAECQRWSEAALSLVAGHQDYQWQEMVLQQGRAIASMFMAGNSGAMLTAVERALALARDLGDRRQELRMLAGLHFYRTSTDNIVGALEVAIESVALVKEMNDPAALAMAEWMLGVAYNLVGDQEAALQHCEAGMTLIDIAGRVSTICFGYDHRIRALSALTHALWLKGAHARALEMTRRTIAEAQQLGHPISYCIALSNASAIFCWNGDWDTADSLADQLCTHANRYMLTSYVAVAQALKGNVLVLRGQACAGVALLRPCLDKLQSGPHQILKMPFMTVLAEGLIALGKVEEAKAVMETAAAVGRDSYHAPEILRVQNILLQHKALAVS